MSYPSSIASFTTKINKNASGWYVGPEYFNVPSTSPYELYLDHVPSDTLTIAVGASGGALWTEVLVAPTAVSQYLVDYVYGKVTFYSGNSGAAAQATYYSLGDDIMAEHINDVQTSMTETQNVLGISPEGAYSTVRARLDAVDVSVGASGISGIKITDGTVRPGAITNSTEWASKIGAVSPGETYISTIQDHIDRGGTATKTYTNPHGMAMADTLSWDSDFTAGEITAKDITVYFSIEDFTRAFISLC